jgi:hypothetical protein
MLDTVVHEEFVVIATRFGWNPTELEDYAQKHRVRLGVDPFSVPVGRWPKGGVDRLVQDYAEALRGPIRAASKPIIRMTAEAQPPPVASYVGERALTAQQEREKFLKDEVNTQRARAEAIKAKLLQDEKRREEQEKDREVAALEQMQESLRAAQRAARAEEPAPVPVPVTPPSAEPPRRLRLWL